MRIIKILVENLAESGDVIKVLGEAEVNCDLDFAFGTRISEELSEDDARKIFMED